MYPTPIEELDIVNRALKRGLGSVAASSMSDTAKNAARAIEAYYDVRDEVLRMINWPFATKRAALLDVAQMATPWTASTYYFQYDRVTNDSGKVYVCATAGTSDSSGGPTGTTDGITDNTVVWDYDEDFDTTTNWAWAASTAYAVDDLVANDTNKLYRCITAGTSASSGGPTGTTNDITDGTAHWAYYGTIPHNYTVYAYQYIYPVDCLRIRKIPDPNVATDYGQGVQFLRENVCIYTDLEDATVLYTRRETNPDAWDVLCRDVVATKIAAEIAYDVTGQEKMAVLAFQKYSLARANAEPAAMSEAREAEPEVQRWEDV